MFILVLEKRVIKEDIPNLPKAIKERMKKAFEEKLCIDPITFGKPLRYDLRHHFRLRVGDYRIVYRVEINTKNVYVLAIQHRKDVY